MEATYHARITTGALAQTFDDAALEEIIAANLSQDLWLNLLRPEVHFDNDKIAESLARVETLHGRIEQLAGCPSRASAQRNAFGRLSHTVQDFYAHSNYVDLWIAARGGHNSVAPDEIEPLDAHTLDHPDLHTGHWSLFAYLVYDAPVLKRLARERAIPPNSHKAMNLDSPDRGPGFPYAFVAARKRTLLEYERAVQAILAASGEAGLHCFHHAD